MKLDWHFTLEAYSNLYFIALNMHEYEKSLLKKCTNKENDLYSPCIFII
jgi:hypothetical protein